MLTETRHSLFLQLTAIHSNVAVLLNPHHIVFAEPIFREAPSKTKRDGFYDAGPQKTVESGTQFQLSNGRLLLVNEKLDEILEQLGENI